MANNSAHEFFDWLFSQFGHRKRIDSGWRRVPPAQDTDGIRLPNVIEGIVGGPAWNGPTGTRRAAYLQEHQRGNTPIPPTRDTPGEFSRAPLLLSAREVHKRNELGNIPTAPSLRQSQEWLHASVPGQHLPVTRQQNVQALPKEEQLDAMLQTMRANSLPLPPFVGFSDPDLTPDLPTEKHTQEQADAWLNSGLKLNPLDSQEIAAVDRTAQLIMPQVWDELETLAQQPANDDTLEVPAVMRKQHMKESEEK